jgi:hypothetical protein
MRWKATGVTLRTDVERRSAVLLVALSRLPRWLVAVLIMADFLGVLLLPTVPAALCLALLLAFLGWLGYLSWPSLDSRARRLRVLGGLVLLALGLQALL